VQINDDSQEPQGGTGMSDISWPKAGASEGLQGLSVPNKAKGVAPAIETASSCQLRRLPVNTVLANKELMSDPDGGTSPRSPASEPIPSPPPPSPALLSNNWRTAALPQDASTAHPRPNSSDGRGYPK